MDLQPQFLPQLSDKSCALFNSMREIMGQPVGIGWTAWRSCPTRRANCSKAQLRYSFQSRRLWFGVPPYASQRYRSGSRIRGAHTKPASVVLGDTPVQGCDFAQLREDLQLDSLVEKFRQRGMPLELIDFRRRNRKRRQPLEVLQNDWGILESHTNLPIHHTVRIWIQ